MLPFRNCRYSAWRGAEELALLHTGIELNDIAQPQRLGRRWLRQTAPKLDPAETAV